MGKRSPYSLLEAVQISTAIMQISLEVPQKIKTRTTAWLSYTVPGTPKNTIGHHRAACTLVCIAAVFTIARKGNPSRHLPTDGWVRTTWHIYTMEY